MALAAISCISKMQEKAPAGHAEGWLHHEYSHEPGLGCEQPPSVRYHTKVSHQDERSAQEYQGEAGW